MMDRDNITRTGARAPGVEWRKPLERRCTGAVRSPAQNGSKRDKRGARRAMANRLLGKTSCSREGLREAVGGVEVSVMFEPHALQLQVDPSHRARYPAAFSLSRMRSSLIQA